MYHLFRVDRESGRRMDGRRVFFFFFLSEFRFLWMEENGWMDTTEEEREWEGHDAIARRATKEMLGPLVDELARKSRKRRLPA